MTLTDDATLCSRPTSFASSGRSPELRRNARQEKRALTGAKKNLIKGWNGGISMNRSRRLATDSLELSGWDPAQDE
jgi:hypothetical protein